MFLFSQGLSAIFQLDYSKNGLGGEALGKL